MVHRQNTRSPQQPALERINSTIELRDERSEDKKNQHTTLERKKINPTSRRATLKSTN